MTLDHERIEELIAVRALGGLDPGDEAALRHEMDEHGPDCAECRRLEAEYAEVAGRLAFALDPVPVREGLEADVLRLARGPGTPALRREAAGRPGVRRALVGVAASLALFVGGWVARDIVGGGRPAVPAGARVVAFQGEGGDLAVAYVPGQPGVYLLGAGLEAPPDGKVYEVWVIQGETPLPGGCFRPSPDGSLFEFVDAELGAADTMAVTIEPASCSTQPTSEPILTARITNA